VVKPEAASHCKSWACVTLQHEFFQSAPGSRVGTPAYLAPEIILTTKGRTYDAKARAPAAIAQYRQTNLRWHAPSLRQHYLSRRPLRSPLQPLVLSGRCLGPAPPDAGDDQLS